MSQLTRIVAIVLNTRLMTVYKEDGTSVVYAQGDPRIRRLLCPSRCSGMDAGHRRAHRRGDRAAARRGRARSRVFLPDGRRRGGGCLAGAVN